MKQNLHLRCTENLHSLWDGAIGFFQRQEDIETLAIQLEKSYPLSQFISELSIENITVWSQETASDRPFIYNTLEYVEPSTIYYQNAQAIAKRQMVLAGYRLGQELNELL